MKPLSNKKTAARRGVLLLVVLAMLVMFGLFAFAFVMLTGHAKRISTAENRKDITFDPPENTLHEALLQVLRGPVDPPSSATNPIYSSAIGPNSLLEDLYGVSVSGTVSSVSYPVLSDGTTQLKQIVKISPSGLGMDLSKYLGCVLTMTSGDAKDHSFRILGTDSGNTYITVLVDGASPDDIKANDQFVVNGLPFAGTGLGYDGTSVTDSALWPNAYSNRYPTGGANEDYDLADYQNMLLALVLPTVPSGYSANVLEPSLHRPSLQNYWYNRIVTSPPSGFTWPSEFDDNIKKWKALVQPWGPDAIPYNADDNVRITANWQRLVNDLAALKRGFTLRPLPEDHPYFNGSNPASWYTGSTANEAVMQNGFWERNGPWDVDNDGDGLPDSIWVDLGLPVRSTPDGRQYKPLFAILVADKDGCVNLNAHDSTASHSAITGPFTSTTNNASITAALPAGLGFGVTDVALDKVLPAADVTKLMQGVLGYQGRYGATNQAGKNAVDDLAKVKFFEYPATYGTGSTGFCSPPDLWGRLAVGLDHRGQPYYWSPLWADFWNPDWTQEKNEYVPYQLNLNSKEPYSGAGSGPDAPFTPAEFERLLRMYDRDAARLADRLVQLAPGFKATPELRHQVTTASFSIPTAPSASKSIISGTGRATIVELLRDKLNAEGVTATAAQNQAIVRILAWDLMASLRMDINRPVGDMGAAGWQPPFASSVNFQYLNGLPLTVVDADGDGNTDQDDVSLMARQVMARHLYVLMMLLWDSNYVQPATGEMATDAKELTIRRIAQWAANVVDFRDADSTMTPFEYDTQPFTDNDPAVPGTWDVDGVLASADDAQTYRRLVWGCEAPELLLTETAAIHDRRVADTNYDTSQQFRGDSPKDDDLDQTRIPEGSVFFELYCTRNPNNPVAPSDLYTNQGGKWYLDLAKMAPSNATTPAYPVWRLAITKTGEDNKIAGRLAVKPYSASLETQQYSAQPASGSSSLLATSSDPDIEIERLVWFTTVRPDETAHRDWNRIYYAVTANARVEAGRFAVVGPRPVTYIGSRKYNKANGIHWGYPSSHQISLMPQVSAGPQYPTVGVDIQQAAGIVVAARYPKEAGWTDQTARIGVSVSEPIFSSLNYYPQPTRTNPTTTIRDAYGDLDEPAATTNYFRDQPLDSQPGSPLADDGILTTGTYADYKSVVLQRLANPNAPHDPVKNPYLTVDWSSIDLTVFNGEDRQPDGSDGRPLFAGSTQWDPDDANWDDSNNTVRLAARQRGWGRPTWQADGNIWAPGGEKYDTATDHTDTTWNFREKLWHTLGYFNTVDNPSVVRWSADPGANTPAAPSAYIGTLVTVTNPSTPPGVSPNRPFPWLAWNNRPYANLYELLNVPASHPARLGFEFSLRSTNDPFKTAVDSTTGFSTPFGHGLNFFMSEADGSVTPAVPAPHFYRLLDYLRVPSRFVGSELVLDPVRFGDNITETSLLRPPFNQLSQYREPGLVNVNTITSSAVWDAVLNGHSGPTFAELQQSRRGYAAGSEWDLDSAYPTRFANPFRDATSNEWAPPALQKARPADVTLLRPDSTGTQPLFRSKASDLCRDPSRNSYFNYETLQHLSSVATTQSNVYAVWITVGYFEVTPADTRGYNLANAAERLQWNRIYPDGYQLGPELGMDTGEIKRHRAFYMIDRSIPVAFERGKDHNVEKTILVKRYIE